MTETKQQLPGSTAGDSADDNEFEAATSFAQQRLWFLDQLEPGSPVYNISMALRLRGELDTGALQIAVDRLTERHETLRTTFVAEDQETLQIISEDARVVVEYGNTVGDADLTNQLRELAAAPFDLAAGPLLRVHALRHGANDHILLLVIHHIIADAWSLNVLYRELSALYVAAKENVDAGLPELPVQYADYAEWQQDWLSGDQLEKQISYWRDHLDGAPELLDLPLDRPRPRVQSHAGATLERQVDPELAARLRALAQDSGCTLFILYMAVYAVLLSRWASTDDLVIGTPIAGRQRKELEGLIGFFVNTLGMRIEMDDNPSFSDLLARAKQASLGAFAHQDLPFEKLVEELQPERSTRYSPLFQVMFVLQHATGDGMPFADLQTEAMMLDTGTAKFDLTLFVTEQDESAALLFEYNTDLFDAATVGRMLDHYETLLQAVVAEPTLPVSRLSLLDERERNQVINDFNRTAFDAQPIAVHELVEAQAARTPDAEAVCFGSTCLTYKELNQRANKLARALLAAGENSRNSTRLAGICAGRGIDTAVSVLAVLKAGYAYVPIDPNYPAERVATMLADSQAAVLISQSGIVNDLPAHDAATLLLDGFDWSDESANSNLGVNNYADGSVYVIYTSGSTGKPKGVELTHKNLSNLIQWQSAQAGLDVPARTLQFASLSFDVSFQELFTTWAQGGCVVLVDEDMRRDLPQLARLIAQDNIERIYLPFAALQPLADAVVNDNSLSFNVKDVIVAGEQLQVTPAVRDMFRALGKSGGSARLHNHYGPSETHVTTAFTLEGNPDNWMPLPPIGEPVANTRVYVLDSHGEPAPVGVPGELYIAGAQVAKGYLHRPELSEEKFGTDPYSKHADERVYRTGDRVRFLPDGNLEYLGRTDDQVKWRGFRIEPGEIETALVDHASVKQAAVLLREDNPGDKRLVAYVVGATVDSDALKSHLKERLPEYMVPSVIVTLDALPLTPSGKLARRALPVPDYADAGQAYVAPRSETEEQLCALWADVLGITSDNGVGVHDDLFDLGGHSLLATQLVSRVRDALEIDVPLLRLFEKPTVAEFAACLDDSGNSASADTGITARGLSEAPLSFAQQRLWFLEQLEPGNPAYNFPVAIEFSGQLNTAALESAINALITRHDSLRTTFSGSGEDARQNIAASLNIALDRHPAALNETELQRKLTALSQLPFDLVNGPLLRAHLLATDDSDKSVLLLVTHHIVSDGWSLGIMLQELATLYRHDCGDGAATLPELPVQYSDYASWQRETLEGEELERQMNFWRDQLAAMPPVLDLPTDRPRPAEQTFNGSSTLRWLDTDLQSRLNELAQAQSCTLYMVLMAAFDVLLSVYGATDEVVVGTPIAGRQRTETEGLIGFLSNTLAIPARLEGDPSFTELLNSVRDSLLDAYEHQDLPFEKLVEELQPERAMSHAPVFQVMFVFQNNPEGDTDFGEVSARAIGFEMGIAKFDLLLEMAESQDGLRTGLQYNTDLYDAATIDRMLGHFETLLRAIVADPDRSVSRLPLLDEGERGHVLTDFNHTAMQTEALAVHALVEQQAQRTPESAALSFASTTLSYKELNNRANRLAGELQKQGAAAGSLVAICAGRGIDTAISVLAVLKSGAAYVPVDPDYPAERVATMLADSGAVVLVTESTVAADLPAHDAATLLLDQFDWQDAEAHTNPGIDNYADGSVYVIYTSGSTGKPKGVELTHRNLSNLIQWQSAQPGLDTPARTLQFASLSFDVSFQELFTTWAQGGCVVLVDEDTRRDLPQLARLIAEDRIERVYLPFAALQPLADAVVSDDSLNFCVKDVVVAGEQLQVTPAVRGMFKALGKSDSDARLHNHYGPSETHVTTAFTLDGNPNDWMPLPPIGAPVANTQVYVLDSHREPVPVGVPGELYLAGEQVAKGYLHQPELTAEKFLADNFTDTPSGRMYRTGDRVRFLADGNLEYLGRTDDQVKWRGFRIEPGEIETALGNHPAVQQAAVLLREDKPGDRRLVAYVVPANTDVDNDLLRNHLRERLPDYMVPSIIVMLDALPLTPSGKLARRALPVPDYADTGETYVAPRNDIEMQLCTLYAEVLGISGDNGVGIRDDFFALGGHSLLATQLISRIRDTLGSEVPLKLLFRNPTTEQLAAALAAEALLRDLSDDDADEDYEEFEL